jgi:arsenate reductase
MFLCTGNACRSQMAEGFARELGKGRVVAFSAGIIAAGVSTRAITVMKEAGIDISGQYSKTVDEELLETMDVIITLCVNAEASCPLTPARIRRLHWPIEDPMGAVGTDAMIMKAFRRARDEIHQKVRLFLESLDH